MNYVAVSFEHVDLFNRLDRLNIELLQRLLKLLVISCGSLGGALDLSPRGAFATARQLAIWPCPRTTKPFSNSFAPGAADLQGSGFGRKKSRVSSVSLGIGDGAV